MRAERASQRNVRTRTERTDVVPEGFSVSSVFRPASPCCGVEDGRGHGVTGETEQPRLTDKTTHLQVVSSILIFSVRSSILRSSCAYRYLRHLRSHYSDTPLA